MNPRVAEILAQLDAFELATKELRAELREILEPDKRKCTPIKLTFDKNIITWNGGAIALKGLGYKIVRTLYEVNDMMMEEATLGERVWGQEPKHRTFNELVRWLMEKLERAKFPYQLIFIMSEEKIIQTGEKYSDGRPKLKHLRPVIIGIKLNARTTSANLAANS